MGLRSFWTAVNSWITASVHTSLWCWLLMRVSVWEVYTRVNTVRSKSCQLNGRRRRASSAVRRRTSESFLGRTSSQMTSSFATLLREANSSSGISKARPSPSICIPAIRICPERACTPFLCFTTLHTAVPTDFFQRSFYSSELTSNSKLVSSTERWNVGFIREYSPRFILYADGYSAGKQNNRKLN